MEHFILFAIALMVIAFLSILLARPMPNISTEDLHADAPNAGLVIGQLNYIPTPVNSTFQEVKATHFSSTEELLAMASSPPYRILKEGANTGNQLIHEEHWI
jgi:hypothetical protein